MNTFLPDEMMRIEQLAPAKVDGPSFIGRLLDAIPYMHDWQRDYRVKSVRTSLFAPEIMCIDAAILAYGLLDLFPQVERRMLGIHRRDPQGVECGHVVALYRDPKLGAWGSFGKSNYPGLGHRPPEYADPTSLAVSYAKAYRRIGFTPLHFGVARLEDISHDKDWRRSADDLNVLSERLINQYLYSFDLRVKG